MGVELGPQAPGSRVLRVAGLDDDQEFLAAERLQRLDKAPEAILGTHAGTPAWRRTLRFLFCAVAERESAERAITAWRSLLPSFEPAALDANPAPALVLADCLEVAHAKGWLIDDFKRPLRAACERSPHAVTVPCYTDEGRSLAELVDTSLRAEGVTIERVFLDIMAGENRQNDFLAKNPRGGSPCLELDDGSFLDESLAICEYLEERHPSPTLIGSNAEERAQARAALRWVDQQIVVPMTNGFRSAEGLPMFQPRMLCIPDASDGNKAYARDGLTK